MGPHQTDEKIPSKKKSGYHWIFKLIISVLIITVIGLVATAIFRLEERKLKDGFLTQIEEHYRELISLQNEGKTDEALQLLAIFKEHNKLDYKNIKKIYINELERKVKPIPAIKARENWLIYHELLSLDSNNPKYQNKVAYYKAKTMEQERNSFADQTSSAVPAPVYDPVQKWGGQKVASARKVMALANQDCRIYEEGPHLVVEMRMYITDPNQRLGYVRAIADSDVILHGQPRNIYFYDPSNKKIAQADTLKGVRLID